MNWLWIWLTMNWLWVWLTMNVTDYELTMNMADYELTMNMTDCEHKRLWLTMNMTDYDYEYEPKCKPEWILHEPDYEEIHDAIRIMGNWTFLNDADALSVCGGRKNYDLK
jgi:hypothetical protein